MAAFYWHFGPNVNIAYQCKRYFDVFWYKGYQKVSLSMPFYYITLLRSTKMRILKPRKYNAETAFSWTEIDKHFSADILDRNR